MDSGSTEPINSVVSDEDLVNQVVPDEEELKERETSPTPNWDQALCVILSVEDRRIRAIRMGTQPMCQDDMKTAEWGESNYWCQTILIELFCTRR